MEKYLKNCIKIKYRITLLYKITIIGLLALTTFCQFGESDAMDSFQGSGDPLFVAVADDNFSYISTDGKSWAKGGTTDGTNCGSVAYGNRRFVAAGGDISGTGTVYTSENDFLWTGPISQPDRIESIVHCNGIFVAVGEDGFITWSENGYNWSGNMSPGTDKLNDITFRP